MTVKLVYEIMVGNDRLLSDRETWLAWTGRRILNGQEWHGPVYGYLQGDNAEPYTGSRVCLCDECQKHVRPECGLN